MAGSVEVDGGSSFISYPGYNRYWTHYRFMQSWMKKHYQVLEQSTNSYDRLRTCSCRHRSQDSHDGVPVFRVPPVPTTPTIPASILPTSQQDTTIKNGSSQTSSSKRLSKAQRKKAKRKRSRSASSCSSNRSTQSSSGRFEADLNDEFLEFMLQSAQHKKDREAKKNKDSQERREVDAKGVLVDDTIRMAAPTEQPGMRRTHEIKLLYGVHSDKVHGMETAQQLCFQQACDRLKPLPWPNIPLKLNFT